MELGGHMCDSFVGVETVGGEGSVTMRAQWGIQWGIPLHFRSSSLGPAFGFFERNLEFSISL